MPYRVRGRSVQVQRYGKWVLLKKHKTAAAARRHAAALRINVPHSVPHRGRKK